MTPLIVLIGPPGAGKTTVGREVASRLGVPLIDTDERIAQQAGKSVSDIFIDDGEPAFRALERQACLEALDQDAVVALGGGAIEDSQIASRLESLTIPVVFLDVDLSTAMSRIGLSGPRPLLVEAPRATWYQLMTKRRPTYSTLASHVIETGDRPVTDIATQILTIVGDGNA